MNGYLHIRMLVVLFAVFLGTIGVPYGHAEAQNNPDPKSYVEELISDLISSDGQKVEIFGLSIGLTGNVQAEGATVSDVDGVWLEISGFSLDWRPLSLLGDTIEVNRLDIEQVTVNRWPGRPPTESDAEAPAPRPVDIGEVQITRIILADGLAGTAAELTARASARITNNPVRVAAEIGIERIDEVGGTYTAKIEYRPETENLDIDIRGSDGPSGLIGTLLNIPGRPEIDLQVSGTGTLDRWDGAVSLRTGTDQALAGEMRIVAVEGGRRIGAALEGSISAFIPEQVRPVFIGRSTLAGSVLVPDGDTALSVESLFLETPAIKIDIAGALDPSGTGNRIRIAIATPATRTRLADRIGDARSLAVTGLNIEAEVTGALANPQWSLTGRAAEIVAGPDSLKDLQLSGAGRANGGTSSSFSLDVTAIADTGETQLWSSLLSGPTEIGVRGAYGANRPFHLTGARFVSQTAQIGLTGSAEPFEGVFDLSVDGSSVDLQVNNALLDRLLSGPGTVSGRLSKVSPDEPLRFSALRLSTPAVDLAIDGTVGDNTLDLAVGGQFTDLSRLSGRAAGSIRFDATMSGPVTRPGLSLNANGADITLSGQPFEAASVRFEGILDPADPAGEFALSGRYQGAPVRAGFRLATDADGNRRLSDLEITMAGAELSGELLLTTDNRPSGNLTFDATDLSTLGGLILTDLQGTVKGSVAIGANGPADRAVIRASGRGVRVREAVLSELDADITIADIRRPAQFTGQARITGASVGGMAFDALSVDGTRRADGLAVTVDADGNTISGSASALIATDGGTRSVTLDGADLVIRGIPVNLVRPARILFSGDEIIVEPSTIAVGAGTITLAGTYGDAADLNATISDVPLAAFDPMAGNAGIAGSLSGTATVSGSAGSPQIDFNVAVSQATARALQQAGLRPVDFAARGKFEGGTVSFNAGLASAGEMQLEAAGSIAVTDTPAIDLSAEGSLPLSVFADRLVRSGLRADGTARISIAVKGPVTQPDIAGSIEIENATIGDADGRFTVTNAAARLTATGDRIELVSLTGNVGEGTLTASGNASLRSDGAVAGNIDIRNGRYVDGTLVLSTFDAALTIGGSRVSGIVVGGDITLLTTTITLNTLPPAANQLADVRHKHPPIPVARQWALLQQRKGQSGTIGLALDLTLRTSNPILVRGRGINADFGGQLRITGSLPDIQPTGRFNLLRGSLSIVGRRLEFDRGSLEFTGNFNPDLDISATSRTSDATVTLTISGTPDDPRVTITSVPELPPEEALANLVFQQSSTELSPVQIARLADAILVLNGGTQSGLFEGLRRIVGIDRFDVNTDAEGNTTVGVGSYLNERTYIGAEQGVEKGNTKVIIDLDITRSFKLRAGAGSDGETEAGIVFEKEY